MYLLCCEGPACNGGKSAKQRFLDIYKGPEPSNPSEAESVAIREARSQVTKSLAVTRHKMVSSDHAKCEVCGHTRRYG